jgi:hypothetical protein
MQPARFYTLLLITCIASGFACNVEKEGMDGHPSIFLVPEKLPGFTSIKDLKSIDKNTHQSRLWNDLLKQSEMDFRIPYIDPSINFKGRDPVHLRHENVSYDLARGVCERLGRASLLFLVTEEEKYKALVMRQIEVLFDTTRWPMWCDDAHVNKPPHVDIRTFRISMWVALCYNWMYNHLTEAEKTFIIDGLDQRAIQPFWEKLAQKPGWYLHRHNWFTNMFGGMGITAMALGDAHSDTQRLLDTIVPEMIDFNNMFGALGEFNEPPGYAGAIRFSVEFAEAYRYYTKHARNLLTEKPFPEIGYWIMYHTLPPGRMMAFGDTNTNQNFSTPAVMAAMANANHDGVLQWYYLNHFIEMKSPMEMLWFNPDLKVKHPNGHMSLGIEYKEHGSEIISRTSWDPLSTHCVVYGKAGRETNHDDNDVGQLCIDGFGERLIIDPGKPKPIYPKDYFGPMQYNYYSRSSKGHNVLVVGDEEMISEPNEIARGTCVRSWFNDSIGSFWQMDLSPVYGNANKVTRKVVHLYPGVVLVHDYAELPEVNKIDLRWHCISPPQWDQEGNFKINKGAASLCAKVVALDGDPLHFSIGRHSFQPPYHLTRQGDPLEQHYEPFIKVSTRGNLCSILTLFSISKAGAVSTEWRNTEAGYEILINDVRYRVAIVGEDFEISSSSGDYLRTNFER